MDFVDYQRIMNLSRPQPFRYEINSNLSGAFESSILLDSLDFFR